MKRARKKKPHSFQPNFPVEPYGTTPTDYLEKRTIIGFQRTRYFFALHSIYNLNRVNPLKIDGKKWIFSFTIVCIFFSLIRNNSAECSAIFLGIRLHAPRRATMHTMYLEFPRKQSRNPSKNTTLQSQWAQSKSKWWCIWKNVTETVSFVRNALRTNANTHIISG